MSNFNIAFEYPWLLLVFLPLAALTTLSYLRAPGTKRSSILRLLPLGLRLAALLLVTLILAAPTITTNMADTAMMLLVDQSDSMRPVSEQISADAALLMAEAPGDVHVGVTPFAGMAELTQPLSKRNSELNLEADVAPFATDLARAMNTAAASMPEYMIRRIVLLTDGLATDGDTMAAAAALAGKGVRVDAIHYDTTTDDPEVAVTAMEVPAEVALASTFQTTVTIHSTADQTAELRLYDEDKVVKSETVSLTAGENSFTYRLTASADGANAYSAEIIPQKDTLPQNNRFWQTLRVSGGNAILLVEGQSGCSDQLAELLRNSGYSVDTVETAKIPRSLADLCEYSLIVLMDVDARDLPLSGASNLEQYVSTYGRSILSTGGSHTYIHGSLAETPIETLLPVSMVVQERESAQPLALMLLMDNSASMEGTAIVMAKRGAIKSIEALNQNDYIGVITFSSEHDVLSPLVSMRYKDDVIADVSRLGTVMGTMYTTALQEAYDQLTAFTRTDRKHVILMSDGNPSDEGFESIVANMAQAGITVSTIAMGMDVSTDLMQRLAVLGGGRCYIVESSYDLPAIMMTDTVLLQVDYDCTGEFTPVEDAQILPLPATLPVLSGYTRVQEKPGAQVVLRSTEGHPIYAQWNHGTGRAGSFMSDMHGDQSAAWFNSAEGKQIMLTMVSALLSNSHHQSALDVALTPGGGESTLQIKLAGSTEGISFTADVTAPSGETTTYTLNDMGEGLYERIIPIDGFGKYGILLRRYESGKLVSELETAASISWSAEYDTFTQREPKQLLSDLTSLTGGELVESAQEVLAISTENMYVAYSPILPMAILAFAIMLTDIVLRKTGLLRRLAMRKNRTAA